MGGAGVARRRRLEVRPTNQRRGDFFISSSA